MIILITATPGSGKTQYAIKEYLLKALAEGRPCYANINGLDIPGVKPSPDDWRDTPEGSLVIYDEAQDDHLFPSDGRPGVSKDERVRAMEKHRHTGHDLVFITQAPTLISAHIRKLVGRHHHLIRVGNMKRIRVITYDGVLDVSDKKELEKKGGDFWALDPAIWKLYKSTTVDTHNKVRIPARLKWLAGFLLVSVVLVGFLGYERVMSVLHMAQKADDPAPSSSPFSPVQVASSSGTKGAGAEPVPQFPDPANLSGCISSLKRCVCYDAQGALMQVDERICRAVVAQPVAVTSILGDQWGGKGRDSQERQDSAGDAVDPSSVAYVSSDDLRWSSVWH